MTQPAPKLRTLFALVLCARFLHSYAMRTFGPNIPAEQHPFLPQDGVFEGLTRDGQRITRSYAGQRDMLDRHVLDPTP